MDVYNPRTKEWERVFTKEEREFYKNEMENAKPIKEE